MKDRNKPVHGMLGGVVQRAAASPLYDRAPGESAMDWFRRTGQMATISGGAPGAEGEEQPTFELLEEEVQTALGSIADASDEDLDALEERLTELAQNEETSTEAVEQAVSAVLALREERGRREDAAAQEEERRQTALAQLEEETPAGDGEGEGDEETPAGGDGETPAEENASTEGEGEGETPAGTGEGETPAGDQPSADAAAEPAEGIAAAGTRRSPARTAARRPSPGSLNRGRPASQGAQPRSESRTRLYAANGRELSDFNAAAQELIKLADAIGHGGGGDGDFVHVGSLRADYPRERIITDPQNGEANAAIIAAVAGPDAIVAAGGFCAPTAVDYSLENISDASRPVRDSLPQVGATRGGVRFAKPVNFDALNDAVRIWTAQDDADAVSDSSVRKPCIRVDCNDFDEVIVRAIPWCLTFGNLGARAWPEQVADALKSVLAVHARVAEAEILRDIRIESDVVNVDATLSATRDLLDALDRAITRYRYFFRTADDFPMRAILPAFLRGMIRSDLARELPGSTDERLAVADATINSFFAARAVNVTWRKDEERGTTGGVDFFGAQSAGALIKWPDSIRGYLFHEGAFGFLSTPEIDFGLVRDSSLNARNDYTIMAETFEGVLPRGFQALAIDFALCPTGATSGTVDVTCGDVTS